MELPVVQQAFGPYQAGLFDQGMWQQIHDKYKAQLSGEGVEFPGEELLAAERLWEAYAAQQRGAVMLNNDGSIVDLSGYDNDATEEYLYPHRETIENGRRLITTTDLGLLSMAGGLVIKNTLAYDKSLAQNLNMINTCIKHFTQTAITIEGWPQPWRRLVAHELEGKGLSFPFDKAAALYSYCILNDNAFAYLKTQHFGGVELRQNTIYSCLEQYDLEQHEKQLATHIAALYDGQTEWHELITTFIEENDLPRSVNWHIVIPALNKAANIAD